MGRKRAIPQYVRIPAVKDQNGVSLCVQCECYTRRTKGTSAVVIEIGTNPLFPEFSEEILRALTSGNGVLVMQKEAQ